MNYGTLTIISKTRMASQIEKVVGDLRVLHGMATEKSAKKNLRRAITSTENALHIYEHHNLKPSHPIPQQQARRDRERNPQSTQYPAMK